MEIKPRVQDWGPSNTPKPSKKQNMQGALAARNRGRGRNTHSFYLLANCKLVRLQLVDSCTILQRMFVAKSSERGDAAEIGCEMCARYQLPLGAARRM